MARDIKIRITGESSGLKSAFADAERSAEGFGSKIGSVLGGIAKGAGLLTAGGIAAAVPLIKDSIGAASDFNEAVSKSQVIFGESAAAIRAWADDAAQNFGQSRQQALDAASTFAIFGQAAGFSGDDLVGFSKRLTELASDFGSFYNTEPQVAIEAIGAALRGESEPIRQFGIMLNDDTLKAVAFSKGLVKAEVDTKKLSKATEAEDKALRKAREALNKYGQDSIQYADALRDYKQAEEDLRDVVAGKVPQLDQATKMQAAYHAILDQSAVAQGDFTRTADGLANKQRTLNAEWRDAKQDLGESFLPAAMAVSDFLLQKVVPALRDVNQWVKDVATTVRESGWAAAFGQVVEDVARTLGDLAVKAWEYLAPRLPGWLESFGGWFSGTVLPWVGERAQEIGGKIAELTKWAWDKLKANLPTWLTAFGQWFTETAVPWVVEKVEAIASAVAGWVPKAWDKTVEKLKEYLKKLEDWFENDGKKAGEEGGGSVTEGVIRGLGRLWLTTQVTLADWQYKVANWFYTEAAPAFAKGMAELWLQAHKTAAAAAENVARASYEIGRDIVAGFIDGILSLAGELRETITRFIWKPVEEARKLLGIFSPSKVFMEMGGQIAEGLAIGITGGTKQVGMAAQALAGAAVISRPSGGPVSINGEVYGAVTSSNGALVARGNPVGSGSSAITPLGLGDDAGGGLSLSAVGLGGGTLTININGVVGEKDAVLRWISEGLRRYGIAVG